MSKSAAKYIRNNVSGRTADLLLDVLYTPAIRKQWRNADVLARFLIDTVANAYECENSTTFADNGFDSMEDAIAVYIDANLGDWTQDSFLESSFGRRTEKEIAIRLGRVMLQNKFFEERQRERRDAELKQVEFFGVNDFATRRAIVEDAHADALLMDRVATRAAACAYNDAFANFHNRTEYDTFTEACTAFLRALDEANMMNAGIDPAYKIIAAMDNQLGARTAAEGALWRDDRCCDIGYLSAVAQRRYEEGREKRERNAMDSLSRACTAFISAISKGHLSLSNACTLINQPDLVHVARCIGLTITSRDGKHYHDLDNSHNVDLLRSALGSGYKSDVIDALKDLRATANM